MDPEYDATIAFRQRHARTWAAARAITGRLSVLKRIYDNLPLFHCVHEYKERYRYMGDDLTKALHEVTQMADWVAYHLVDLGLYLVVDAEGYKGLAGALQHLRRHACVEGSPTPELHVYQLVLSGKTQRFVFTFAQPTLYERIVQRVQACFGKAVAVTQALDQVNVGIEVSTEMDIVIAHSRLYEHVRQAGDNECVSAMHFIVPKQHGSYLYREYAHRVASSPDLSSAEIMRCMRDTTHVTMVTDDTLPVDHLTTARRWIQDNPPHEREGVRLYNARYRIAVGDIHVSREVFVRLMHDANYKQVHMNHANVWRQRDT